jgi:Glycosyltransferase family 87
MRNVNWLRLGRDAMLVLGVLATVAMWWYYTFGGLGLPVDAHYYWAADPAHLYPHPELAEGNGYNYSPAFEYVVGWGRLLPFATFMAIWRAMLLGAVVYLAGPLTLLVLLLVPVASEVNAGNIQILLALAIVLGFRWPGAWSFVLLTKVSPGVGLLWFVVRREWRPLFIVGGMTAALILASLVTHGSQWPGYVALITSGAAPAVSPYYLSLWVRLPPAIVLVVIGARVGWRWTVVAAATLALPVFYIISWSMLIGILPFVREATGLWMVRRGWTFERVRTVAPPPIAEPRPVGLSR